MTARDMRTSIQGLKKVGKSPPPKKEETTKAPFQEAKLRSVTPRAKPPRMELEMDKKWNVEYYKDNNEVIVDQALPKHTVYIFQCQDSVIQVRSRHQESKSWDVWIR